MEAMTPPELREGLATVLDALETVLPDLQRCRDQGKKELAASLVEVVAHYRARLAQPDNRIEGDEPLMPPKGGPGKYRFEVVRQQTAEFEIEAESVRRAFHAAAVHLHKNIESLRFRWDKSNQRDLSVLNLVNWPEGPCQK